MSTVRASIHEEYPVIAPVVLSASRSTDIPARHAKWFVERLREGWFGWVNPFNQKRYAVSLENTRAIVFWTKHAAPLISYLDEIEERGFHFYFQYTLNDYVAEGLEKGVPSVERRIDTFKRLVDRLGVGKVIWRFDPLILTDSISVNDLLRKAESIGNELKGYTDKMVFSFADIAAYRKVRAILVNNNVRYREFEEPDMLQFAAGIQQLNNAWGYTLATCGEKIDIDAYGIVHNKCIDDDLMIKYFSDDTRLMDFLGVEITGGDLFHPEKTVIKHRNNKDKGQRQFCGCIVSKDIGEYNTCAHLCEYCYANSSKEVALRNLQAHKVNPFSETIIGK